MTRALDRIRTRLAPASKAVLFRSGALTLLREVLPSRGVAILRYHAICGDEGYWYADPGICVTPQAFEKHCRYLSTHYSVLPMPEVVARIRDNRYTLGGRGARAKDSGEVTEANWFVYTKYDHFLTKKWYGYANANFENDRFKDIYLRSTLGVGTGYQFIESEKNNLSLEGGLTYVHTDFTNAPDDDYPAGRWAIKFDHLLFDTRVQFFHYDEAYVNLENAEDTFVRSQTGLRVPLTKDLNATAQYNFDWDNTPAPGAVRDDGTLLMTLGYRW